MDEKPAVSGEMAAIMVKRSQNKSRVSAIIQSSYKKRLFCLKDTELRYFELSSDGSRKSEKGFVPLSSVTIIAEIEHGRFGGRANFFQVIYSLNNKFRTLYISAGDEKQRDQWISALRTRSLQCGATLSDVYHSAPFTNGRYTCCSNTDVQSAGCKTLNGALPRVSQTSTIADEQHADDLQTALHYVAVRHYEATSAEQLNLEMGDSYLVATDRQLQNDSSGRNANWIKLRSFNNDVGLAPLEFLQPIRTLGDFDWYYDEATREYSEKELTKDGRDGCFLVRICESDKSNFVLDLYAKKPKAAAGGKIFHYKVINTNAKYYINKEKLFNSLPELVTYHKHNSDSLIVRLRFAPAAQNSEVCGAKLQALLETGCRIDCHELDLQEEVGSGQFGVVRRAFWRGGLVAVKQLNAGSMNEEDFVSEARLMRQLHHPNLVKFFGVVESPLWIVTEFMCNGSLLQFLNDYHTRLLKNSACDSKGTSLLIVIATQVCDAMSYLEEKHFIHRDLAARNCLVDECDWRDEYPDAIPSVVVKVADLGLTRHAADDEYTSSSGGKVSVRWAAPEVLSHSRFSSKSDVWAFGVLCWELFSAGETPFANLSNAEVINATLEQIGNMRLDRPLACTAEIYKIMCSTWNFKPSDRPSFQDIRKSIRDMQPHNPALSANSIPTDLHTSGNRHTMHDYDMIE